MFDEKPVVEPEGGLEPEWRYDFLMALNQAILRFTAEAVAADPRAFLYRGAELRHAVERQLYYAFGSDPALRAVYRTSILHKDEPIAALTRAMTAALAAAVPVPSVRVSRLRRAASRLRRRLNALRETAPVAAVDVLFMVRHDRFVGFFLPLLPHLGLEAGFLTCMNAGLAESIRDRGWAAGNADAPGGYLAELPAGLAGMEFLAGYVDAFRHYLQRARPCCVVVPEGCAPIYEALNRVCGQLGIATVCVQQGWSPYPHPGVMNLSYGCMTVWGKSFADLLRPLNPRQTFAVSGTHMVRYATESDARGTAISFFLSGSRAFAQTETLISAQMHEDFLDLIAWTAKSFPEARVLVRGHPQATLSEEEKAALRRLPNLELVDPAQQSIDAMLRQSRVSIAIYSTTILDSIARGVPPIIVNATALPKYSPDMDAAGAGVEVKDFVAARRVIRRAVEEPEFLRQYRERMPAVRADLFACCGREAVKATTCCIRDLCGKPPARDRANFA